MKTLKWMVLAAVLIFLPAISFPQPRPETGPQPRPETGPVTLGFLRVSLIEGDVQINTVDTEDWVPASINMPLRDGDRLWVPEGGRAELQLRDGTAVRVDEKTSLDIIRMEKDSSQFYLAEGRAYANFAGLRGTVLQIDTPVSSVRAYDQAIFRVDILDERYTDVSVYMGSVYAESQDGRTRVDENTTLALREGFPAELGPMGPPDEWEAWNKDRNRKYVERRAPSRHLPEELQSYSSDFEDNGRWVNVREYGYVWTPTVVVSAEWAPYRVGRWVWIGGDYVWISHEPWGWAPYHYGRWSFVPTFGWCWVPPRRGAVYWGPGFVGWVQTPTHVSWVPLAPGEIYYGHGHYGPHSVNITNINVTNINVQKIVYKNVNVRNSVTVVNRNTFISGKHEEVRVKENPFLREKLHIGRPDIKPERATRMPVVREIPQTKRPPEKIREIKVREIKERRPLAREKDASVLRPQSPPKEMEIKRIERPTVQREPEKGRERRPEMERGRQQQAPRKEIEKPREKRPLERGIEKPGVKGPGTEIEKRPRERRPPGGGIEKPQEFKPQEKGIEKPGGRKPDTEIEKRPRERKPPTEGIGKPQEFRPQERGIEKPGGRGPETGIEKPRENRKPSELERRPPGRETGPTAPRQIEKPTGQRPPERGRERIREEKPVEKGIEKPREMKPQGRELEKPQEGSKFLGPKIQGAREFRPQAQGKIGRAQVRPPGQEAIGPRKEQRSQGRGIVQTRQPRSMERERSKVNERGLLRRGAGKQKPFPL